MRKFLLTAGAVSAIAILGALATAAYSADDIAARKDLMKKNGAAVKATADMLGDGGTFDAAKAAENMKTVVADLTEFVTHFPETSMTGGETTASPEIWKQMDKFKASAKQLVDDATAAADAAAKGKDEFAAAFGKATGNCKSCHETFRVQK